MKKYLLDVTFYINSDKEDMDRDLFLLCVNKEITESEMYNIFESIPYEGNNINALMEHVGNHTNGSVVEIYSNCGSFKGIDNYYMIEL